MSAINTNGINSNYPVPGVNNNSQGFRDNFASVKNSLDTASIEITDIQNKAIVKSGLTGINLNNDMANTLISNALVKSFRATTYNLGSNVSETQKVNVNLADVHYGTITADTTIDFGGWAPSGTQSNVQLVLTIANAAAVITLPPTTLNNSIPVDGMTASARLLENYSSNVAAPGAVVTYTNTLTVPAGVNQLHYVISTLDCGKTMEIVPVNRSQRASQVVLAGTPTVSNVTATGTITADDNSTAVTGSGTAFLTELETVNGVPGRVILDSTGTVIGTVLSVEDDGNLTLENNSSLTLSGVAYKRQLPTGDNTDFLGAVKVDANYVYICTANFDATNPTKPIWKRISPSAY